MRCRKMADKFEIKKEIEDLRARVSYHARKYYVDDAPEISDYDYDMMFDRLKRLEAENPEMAEAIPAFAERIRKKGVEPELTYLFMHGHTLMDNVVMVVLEGVCEKLRQLSLAQIIYSSKEGVALKNEVSNYNNSLRSIRDVLLDNDNYTSSPLYKRLKADIQRYIDTTIAKQETK